MTLLGGAMLISHLAYTNNAGAPTGKTGSPKSNGQTCAVSGCHSGGSVTNQQVTITTDIPSTGFVPNTDYNITVTANSNGVNGGKIGYSASIEANGSFQGTVSSLDNRSKVVSGNYMSHTSAGTGTLIESNSWTFKWNSGSAVDQTTIYAVANFTNGNGTTSGDVVIAQTLVLQKNTIGLEEQNLTALSVFPVPARDFSNISFDATEAGELAISLVTMDGRVTNLSNEHIEAGSFSTRVDLRSFAAGNYILHLSLNGRVSTKHVVIE